MPEKLIFHVKGSAPEPYVVVVTLSPLSVSCNCQAALSGLPCKHRILILSGKDPGIVEGDTSTLVSINKEAEAAGVFDLLKSYENAKAAVKEASTASEKAFKKYRTARLELLEKQVKTDKAVIKSMGEMEAAIEGIIPANLENNKALKAIRKLLPFNYDDR